MYVIFKIREEQDYGYGGWKETSTRYFEIVGYTKDENKAKKIIRKLEDGRKSGYAEYDYELASNLDEE